jgi:hypothetical protein
VDTDPIADTGSLASTSPITTKNMRRHRTSSIADRSPRHERCCDQDQQSGVEMLDRFLFWRGGEASASPLRPQHARVDGRFDDVGPPGPG